MFVNSITSISSIFIKNKKVKAIYKKCCIKSLEENMGLLLSIKTHPNWKYYWKNVSLLLRI